MDKNIDCNNNIPIKEKIYMTLLNCENPSIQNKLFFYYINTVCRETIYQNNIDICLDKIQHLLLTDNKCFYYYNEYYSKILLFSKAFELIIIHSCFNEMSKVNTINSKNSFDEQYFVDILKKLIDYSAKNIFKFKYLEILIFINYLQLCFKLTENQLISKNLLKHFSITSWICLKKKTLKTIFLKERSMLDKWSLLIQLSNNDNLKDKSYCILFKNIIDYYISLVNNYFIKDSEITLLNNQKIIIINKLVELFSNILENNKISNYCIPLFIENHVYEYSIILLNKFKYNLDDNLQINLSEDNLSRFYYNLSKNIHNNFEEKLNLLKCLIFNKITDIESQVYLSNLVNLDNKAKLEKLLDSITNDNILYIISYNMGFLNLKKNKYYKELDNKKLNRELIYEIYYFYLVKKESIESVIYNTSVLPKETTMFNYYSTFNLFHFYLEHESPIASDGNYNDVKDFLIKNFISLGYNTIYEIQKVIVNEIILLRPIYYSNYDNIDNTLDEKIGLLKSFKGYFENSINIDSINLLQIKQAIVNENLPSLIIAEINYNLSLLNKTKQKEWDNLNSAEPIFLVSLKKIENLNLNKYYDFNDLEIFNINLIRGCYVSSIIDENNIEITKNLTLENNLKLPNYKPSGFKRKMFVYLEPSIYQEDLLKRKDIENTYSSFHIMIKFNSINNIFNFDQIKQNLNALNSIKYVINQINKNTANNNLKYEYIFSNILNNKNYICNDIYENDNQYITTQLIISYFVKNKYAIDKILLNKYYNKYVGIIENLNNENFIYYLEDIEDLNNLSNTIEEANDINSIYSNKIIFINNNTKDTSLNIFYKYLQIINKNSNFNLSDLGNNNLKKEEKTIIITKDNNDLIEVVNNLKKNNLDEISSVLYNLDYYNDNKMEDSGLYNYNTELIKHLTIKKSILNLVNNYSISIYNKNLDYNVDKTIDFINNKILMSLNLLKTFIFVIFNKNNKNINTINYISDSQLEESVIFVLSISKVLRNLIIKYFNLNIEFNIKKSTDINILSKKFLSLRNTNNINQLYFIPLLGNINYLYLYFKYRLEYILKIQYLELIKHNQLEGVNFIRNSISNIYIISLESFFKMYDINYLRVILTKINKTAESIVESNKYQGIKIDINNISFFNYNKFEELEINLVIIYLNQYFKSNIRRHIYIGDTFISKNNKDNNLICKCNFCCNTIYKSVTNKEIKYLANFGRSFSQSIFNKPFKNNNQIILGNNNSNLQNKKLPISSKSYNYLNLNNKILIYINKFYMKQSYINPDLIEMQDLYIKDNYTINNKLISKRILNLLNYMNEIENEENAKLISLFNLFFYNNEYNKTIIYTSCISQKELINYFYHEFGKKYNINVNKDLDSKLVKEIFNLNTSYILEIISKYTIINILVNVNYNSYLNKEFNIAISHIKSLFDELNISNNLNLIIFINTVDSEEYNIIENSLKYNLHEFKYEIKEYICISNLNSNNNSNNMIYINNSDELENLLKLNLNKQ